MALLALAVAVFVLLHARHSRARSGRLSGGGGQGALSLPQVTPQVTPTSARQAASTGPLIDATNSESSQSQASALKAFLESSQPEPASFVHSRGSSGGPERSREAPPQHVQHAALLLGRHAATASSASGATMHSGSMHSSRSQEEAVRRAGAGVEAVRSPLSQGGSSRPGSARQGVGRHGPGSDIRDLRESLNNAVADVQGDLSNEEPSFKVFSVLGQGGFGTVYHGAFVTPHTATSPSAGLAALLWTSPPIDVGTGGRRRGACMAGSLRGCAVQASGGGWRRQ